MNRFMKFGLIALLAVGLTACGTKVEIPAAHVGKIMTKNGYKDGTVGTSKFRLDMCWTYCDKMVLLNVSDQAVTESMVLFMPKDRLNMKFDIRLTLAVKPSMYDELFERITPSVVADSTDTIPLSTAYNTYAQQIIRAEAREFLSQYEIAEIASSREAINAALSERLSKSIEARTPFQVRYAGLADVAFPEVITTAQENAAERREQIQQEEAQFEIRRVQLELELEEQRMKRMIEVEKAAAEAEVNKILADSVTPMYIQYRSLNIMEQIAISDNKVFMPTEMLNSVSGQVSLGIAAK